jgi:3-oxoacyl-[acyl-carrier protein] reductase
MSDLEKRVALVTGGSRGIGRAIALALGRAGAPVAVNYHTHVNEAEAVVADIRNADGRAIAVQADVSKRGDVEKMARKVETELGPVEILVNNAGIATVRGLDDLTEEDFDQTLTVNLKSAFLCTQQFLPGMRQRRWGRIVNMSSIAARGGGAIGVHYNASKAAMEGMTRGYAARLAAEGVTVNAVAPALIDTDMMAPLKQSGRAPSLPVGRFGTAEETAQATLMVLQNGFMTGQTIAINGGLLFS